MYDNVKINARFHNVAKSATFQNIITAYRLRDKRVLDIGCSYGEHLVHFGKGSVGLTITEPEIDFGKEKGINIRYGNIESSDFKTEGIFPAQGGPAMGWDAIFANNVLEHLFSPHYFLYKSRELLKENGILILGVPCVPKIVLLMHIQKFRGSLSLPHINFWTGDTLRRTVERGGFTVHETRGFHFQNKMLDAFFEPVYPHFYCVATPIKNFTYPEKRMGELMDRMTVTFKK
ncbi:MAG: class I SAM-dependent methyltransferase [Candidatus Niyogibacteria bacterium]|nr:class I SAM-dependent methyltransferase [Candidatus Niyogibacteria bacterium]